MSELPRKEFQCLGYCKNINFPLQEGKDNSQEKVKIPPGDRLSK